MVKQLQIGFILIASMCDGKEKHLVQANVKPQNELVHPEAICFSPFSNWHAGFATFLMMDN